MKAEELITYIETLSKAHAAGHKCDKEIKTAVELYTAEIGIKDLETQINEKTESRSIVKSKTLIREFAGQYYDFLSGHSKLVKSSEIIDEFRKFVEKRA